VPTLIATGEHDVGSNVRMAGYMPMNRSQAPSRNPAEPTSHILIGSPAAGDSPAARVLLWSI
jgi:hypothetical protein